MTNDNIEISVKGNWVKVPALNVDGKTIVIKGKWIRTAVIHDESWLEEELEDPESCVERLASSARHGLSADIFTFSQKPSSVQRSFPYKIEWDSVAAIRLTTFKDWWEKLPQEARKNVRRSQKRGVEVRVVEFNDDLVQSIREVHNDSPMRQGEPNNYYGKTFDEIRRAHSSFLDRSDFIGAYHGSELIGFVKLVYRGETASILNFVPKASHSDKRPANVLVAKVVELCEAKGVTHITYGMLKYGNKRNSSLEEFKIRNGFEEVLVPRHYVPLTARGALCLKWGLHRGLVGILPPGVIAAVVDARTKWYHFKHKPV